MSDRDEEIVSMMKMMKSMLLDIELLKEEVRGFYGFEKSTFDMWYKKKKEMLEFELEGNSGKV